MGSLPLLTLAIEEADDVPSLRMHELMASLFHPLEMMPCSPNGENLLCRGIFSPLAAIAAPLAYVTVGRAGVPKLKRVGAAGTPIPPSGRVAAPSASPAPPA